VAQVASGDLQSAKQRSCEAAFAELRDDVHPLEFRDTVPQILDPSPACRDIVNKTHDVRAAGRGEIRGRCGRPAAKRAARHSVVLSENGGDQIARWRYGGV
jgi:hypothetical protein